MKTSRLFFLFCLLVWGAPLGHTDDQAEEEKKAKAFGRWYQIYLDEDYREPFDKAKSSKLVDKVTLEAYQNYSDQVMLLLGDEAADVDHQDKPRRRRATQNRWNDYYPNLDIAICYFKLGRLERAQKFLTGSNCLDPQKKETPPEYKNSLVEYREKVTQELAFIQGVERALDEIELFRQNVAKQKSSEYKKRLNQLEIVIEDLREKHNEYDTSRWLMRAEEYQTLLAGVYQVIKPIGLIQKKGGGPKQKPGGGGMMPDSRFRRFARRSEARPMAARAPIMMPLIGLIAVAPRDEDADMLLAAADVTSKAYKKSEEKRKKGEDAMAKGDVQDAIEHFSDALDFLEAANASPEELAPIQKLKEGAQQKAGGGEAAPADALAHALAEVEKKGLEAEPLLKLKNPEAKDLRKAKNLLVDSRNILLASKASEAKVNAVAQTLEQLELTIKDRVVSLLAKVKGGGASLDDQVKWLKEVEILDPTNQEVKALLPQKYTQIDEEVNRLYRLGMNSYSDEKIKEAIEIWKKAVTLREVAQQAPHKRLMSDLAQAEQKYKLLRGG